MSAVAIERNLFVAAPVSRVWEVVSAFDEYHKHTATLARTVIVSGEGRGAVRHCVDSSGKDWYETCTSWEREREFGFEVDVSTYPLTYRALFRAFRGTWRVDPIDGGAVVTVRFDAEVRRIPGASTFAARLSERAESELESILESYRVAAEGVDGSDGEDCGKEVGEYGQTQ